MELITLIASFLGGSAIGTLITQFFNRKKIQSEADLNTSEAAAKIIEMYDRALKNLEEKVCALEKRVTYLQDQLVAKDVEIAMLRAHVENGS